MKSLTLGSLRQLYKDLENSKIKPTLVYFQGYPYKIGSKKLEKALDNWYKENGTSKTKNISKSIGNKRISR